MNKRMSLSKLNIWMKRWAWINEQKNKFDWMVKRIGLNKWIYLIEDLGDFCSVSDSTGICRLGVVYESLNFGCHTASLRYIWQAMNDKKNELLNYKADKFINSCLMPGINYRHYVSETRVFETLFFTLESIHYRHFCFANHFRNIIFQTVNDTLCLQNNV